MALLEANATAAPSSIRTSDDSHGSAVSMVISMAAWTRSNWLLDRAHDESLAFPFGESAGEPSRWNTLRALRVLRWYEQDRDSTRNT
jgi:hypothetical protein